jgi:hypothetical protein
LVQEIKLRAGRQVIALDAGIAPRVARESEAGPMPGELKTISTLLVKRKPLFLAPGTENEGAANRLSA